jgi:hypothetical protein
MPYDLAWEARGVYRRYLGDVTIADRRASFEAICSDPRFDDLRYTITDYRAVETYEATKDDTAEIAALHIGPLMTNPRIVMAAVADRADIISAIEDFIEHGFTTAPYQVFRTVDDARQWISTVSKGRADASDA